MDKKSEKWENKEENKFICGNPQLQSDFQRLSLMLNEYYSHLVTPNKQSWTSLNMIQLNFAWKVIWPGF